MGFRELNLKSSYETLIEDTVQSFYVPVLEQATAYDRIAGYFSSTSLALAARGIAGLIKNHGTMRLLVSPNLTPDDYREIRNKGAGSQNYIEETMLRDLDCLGNSFRDNHVRALGWMLAHGLLEIRIACVINDEQEDTGALFHQKVGILYDETGDSLSFSGSINETASGWLQNSEEFKVFCEWDDGQRGYYQSDKEKFSDFWNGLRPYVKTLEPSDAFRAKLVQLGDGFDADRLVLKHYVAERKEEEARQSISLFSYQAKALEEWDRNGRSMLFEMATGTGKTRTAIACINLAKAGADKFICIVAAPEITLARQWDKEFRSLDVVFDDVIFADGSSGGRKVWEKAIARAVSGIGAGLTSSLLVLVTHASACGDAFVALFETVSPDIKICFVGDEVHGIGARKQRRALLERYDYRIGLSATPTRWFDSAGTKILVEYFGSHSFVFSIADAQHTINPITGEPFLAAYEYIPVFVSLNDEEMERYSTLSEKITRLAYLQGLQDDDDIEEYLERLLEQRADIMKNAQEKLAAFEDLIRKRRVERTLIFTSPQQIRQILKILAQNRIAAHPFTQEQGTRVSKDYGGMSERDYLIASFKAGAYQALVAISCLDEGIDIPAADTAILLSSSTNPREYIQRIGRVIRYSKGKEKATVIDFVVQANTSRITDPRLVDFERNVFSRELRRIEEIASNAVNAAEVVLKVGEKRERMYGI